MPITGFIQKHGIKTKLTPSCKLLLGGVFILYQNWLTKSAIYCYALRQEKIIKLIYYEKRKPNYSEKNQKR